jgi:tetratricopeptide (TPR) repeat protein
MPSKNPLKALWLGLDHVLRYLRARFYHMRGAMHRYFGNQYGDREPYLAAIDDFTTAIEIDPNYAQAYLDRGILYWREFNHPRRAIMDLTTAETLDPSLSEACFNRGIAYQILSEYEQAIAEFQAYLAKGEHPYWREYAQKMIAELSEWTLPDSKSA